MAARAALSPSYASEMSAAASSNETPSPETLAFQPDVFAAVSEVATSSTFMSETSRPSTLVDGMKKKLKYATPPR